MNNKVNNQSGNNNINVQGNNNQLVFSNQLKFPIITEIITHINSSKEGVNKGDKDDSIIGIQEKIKKNNLSEDFKKLLLKDTRRTKISQIGEYFKSGLISSKEIENVSDTIFQKYSRIKINEQNADMIFHKLVEECCPDTSNEEMNSGTISLLGYFFQTCEIFEK